MSAPAPRVAPEPACGGCLYARPIEGVPTLVAVACCRNVPSILGAEPIEDPDTRLRWGHWPAVKPGAWCGEYKQGLQLNPLLEWCRQWWPQAAAK